jgi:DNA-binding response OmpR family regulator
VRKRIQILVVDDEEMVRRSMKMLLEHDGHEVCLADSGEAALEILAQRKFELVITDFSMPGMHGDQLVVRIRQLIPNQPIIMASAFVEEYKIFGEASGQVDALLLKPFGMKELRAAIEQVLIQAPPEQTSDLPPMAKSLPAPDITFSPGTPR